MSNLAISSATLPATSPGAVRRLADVQDMLIGREQIELRTSHVLHAGMYCRTVKLEPGTVIVGALIKLATMLIVQGHCHMTVDDGSTELEGYHVIPASAGRKQAFLALEPTYITMIFPTQAQTVEQAEEEFTDEASLLMSRRKPGDDVITVTGE